MILWSWLFSALTAGEAACTSKTPWFCGQNGEYTRLQEPLGASPGLVCTEDRTLIAALDGFSDSTVFIPSGADLRSWLPAMCKQRMLEARYCVHWMRSFSRLCPRIQGLDLPVRCSAELIQSQNQPIQTIEEVFTGYQPTQESGFFGETPLSEFFHGKHSKVWNARACALHVRARTHAHARCSMF